MARSRLGGTKAKLSGKVGSELFSVVKGENGMYIQVVSSIPEKRAYSNTKAQAMNRLTMGTIEYAMNTYGRVIEASFEGISDPMQSYNEFVKINYPFVRDTVDWLPDMIEENEWLVDNAFDFPRKGVAQPIVGYFQIARGSLRDEWLSPVRFNQNGHPHVTIDFLAMWDGATVQDFYWRQGMRAGDYWTFVFACPSYLNGHGGVFFVRVECASDLEIDAPLDADTVPHLFTIVGQGDWSLSWDEQLHTVSLNWKPDEPDLLNPICAWGHVLSRYVRGAWRHNNATMSILPIAERGEWFRTPLDVWPSWYNGE